MAFRPSFFLVCIGLGGGAVISLASCQTEPKIRRSKAPTPPAPQPIESTRPQAAPATLPITFQVSIDRSETDLLIEPGSFIRKGEVIANSAKKRAALTAQKRELESRLSALTNTRAVNLGTQLEEENIALAQKRLENARAALEDYQQNSPWTDFARDNLPLAEEEVTLTRLQAELQQAQINLDQAKSKLTEKQAAIRNFQSEQNSVRQRVQLELAQVNQKIAALKTIKSEHTGTIKKVDVPPAVAAGKPVTVTVELIPGEIPQPLVPNRDIPAGLPPEFSPPSGGGLPSDGLPPDLTLPNSPNRPRSTELPNSTAVPNSGTE